MVAFGLQGIPFPNKLTGVLGVNSNLLVIQRFSIEIWIDAVNVKSLV